VSVIALRVDGGKDIGMGHIMRTIALANDLKKKQENKEVFYMTKDDPTALNKLKENDFDLLLLDIMLPGLNGMEVCSRIREFSDIPIIMLTAKSDLEDKVEGLDTGADDYLTKPFEIEELLARIRAHLRRDEGNVEADNVLKTADVEVNLDAHIVKRAEEEIELTKKEYDLLVYLIKNEGIVVSRDKLLNNVWGYDYTGETNIVDVYIRYLRSKIDDPYDQKLIHTVRGVGYVLRSDKHV
jgi:DNA-binding response OmpR family regulator